LASLTLIVEKLLPFLKMLKNRSSLCALCRSDLHKNHLCDFNPLRIMWGCCVNLDFVVDFGTMQYALPLSEFRRKVLLAPCSMPCLFRSFGGRYFSVFVVTESVQAVVELISEGKSLICNWSTHLYKLPSWQWRHCIYPKRNKHSARCKNQEDVRLLSSNPVESPLLRTMLLRLYVWSHRIFFSWTISLSQLLKCITFSFLSEAISLKVH
jgi:hypothetical protein